jgi:ketosteroid isomerase-like protein
MPLHHPAVQGQRAIVQYFQNLFSRSRFTFALTSSQIHIADDTALERVAYTAIIWRKDDGRPIEDVGKGLHVYRRQPNGVWQLTHDIWNSDPPAAS